MIQKFYSKLSDQGKKLFYAVIALWVLALFDMLFFRPVMSKLVSLDREIHERTNSIHSDARFLSYRDKILRERDEFSVYESGESKTEEEIIGGFLKTVELLASEAKINSVKLKPSDVIPKKGYIQYFANLECDGRLEDMITFMHKINASENLLKVVKFTMTGKRASAEEVNASMRISKLIIDLRSIGDYPIPGDEEMEIAEPKGPAFASSGESEDEKSAKDKAALEEYKKVKGTSIWARKFRGGKQKKK